MAYTDELELVLEAEAALRRRIALRIAEEEGMPATEAPGEQHLQAAEAAIEGWAADAEDDHDDRAFRPQTPLQDLLAEHRAICERILDIQDRRLS